MRKITYYQSFLLVILFIVISTLLSSEVREPFHAIILTTWAFIVVFTLLAFGNSELVAKVLKPHFRLSPEAGDFWYQPKEHWDVESPDKIDDEWMIDTFIDGIPYGPLLILSLTFTLLIIYDILLGNILNDQIYGLLLDGVGGVILAIDALRASIYPSRIDIKNGIKSSIEAFWGFFILGSGFGLQILYFALRSLQHPTPS